MQSCVPSRCRNSMDVRRKSACLRPCAANAAVRASERAGTVANGLMPVEAAAHAGRRAQHARRPASIGVGKVCEACQRSGAACPSTNGVRLALKPAWLARQHDGLLKHTSGHTQE